MNSVFVSFLVLSIFLANHCTFCQIADLFDIADDLNIISTFKDKFRKTYDDSIKEKKAIRALKKNLDVIKKQNQKFKNKKSKFQTDVWEESDLDPETFERSLMGYRGIPQLRNIKSDFPSGNINASKNYVTEGMVTRVMYQRHCGSCWAFSTTGAIEGAFKKKTGNLVKISEQNLIDCNKDNLKGNWGCGGGTMLTAYDFISNQGGINTAFTYRYVGEDSGACKYDARNSILTIKDFVRLPSGNETVLMLALANVGPIAVAIDASQPTFQNYKSGVYDDPNCTGLPNHAVLLVGYGNDSTFGKFWLVKNSWSTSWGESGYIRIARDQNNLCNIAFDASYPIL